jgi:hypothetical protein
VSFAVSHPSRRMDSLCLSPPTLTKGSKSFLCPCRGFAQNKEGPSWVRHDPTTGVGQKPGSWTAVCWLLVTMRRERDPCSCPVNCATRVFIACCQRSTMRHLYTLHCQMRCCRDVAPGTFLVSVAHGGRRSAGLPGATATPQLRSKLCNICHFESQLPCAVGLWTISDMLRPR